MSQLQNLKKLAVSLSAVAVLSGCGSSELPEDAVIVDSMKEYGCNTINVYNAGEYIADETVPMFEQLYTAHVNYVTFDSNEMLYTRLLGGSLVYSISLESNVT